MGFLILALILIISIVACYLFYNIFKTERIIKGQTEFLTYKVKGAARGAAGYMESQTSLECSRKLVNSKRSKF